MKINLIGMILNGAATPEELAGLIIRDDGSSIDDPAEVLDMMFREYVNVANGGTSNLVNVPTRFVTAWTERVASVRDCNCGKGGK